ncbi:MAG: ABC transporter permease [Chloroflexi bacterium]|nr:ABC transporter permease [Chloroflexota bacterium]MBV9132439.1 ABC transporter permease [Chloroflexota bacterium]MBV9897999.1 ABC transporter permease [Chloroflexota bacterium]
MSRLVQAVVVLVLVSAITFFLVNAAPGGPSALMRIDATPEQRDALIRRFGLDRPVPLRYLDWLGGAVHGDLGTSMLTQEPVLNRIADRLPNTLLLSGLALSVSIALGIPTGVIAALHRGTTADYTLSGLSLLGLSIPAFWLGIMLILTFSVNLQVLPSSGVATTGAEFSLTDRLEHVLMPAVVLSTAVLPYVVRFTRSAMLEVLSQDYIRTATAKGLSAQTVTYAHALRNALVPVISIIGTLIPRLAGGAVVTEAVFGWPGMGRLAVEAANGRDYPLIVGITVVIATVVILTSFVVDLAYTWIDPRIRLA